MAGQSLEKEPHGNNSRVAENSPKSEREKRKKTERKVLPKPIPDPTPVCSCAENRIGPKKPYDSCAHTHPLW